jgi:hypothetical protein
VVVSVAILVLLLLALAIAMVLARLPPAMPVGGDPSEIGLAPRAAGDETGLKSPASDTVTRVRFENRSGRTLDLYWLDFEGHRKHYGTIAAGGEIAQPTYVGHVWLLADQNGDAVAIFVADRAPGLAVVS